MTSIKSGVKLVLAATLLISLAGCGGAGFPVALKGSGPTNTSGSGGGSSSGGSITTGSGTTQCGDGSKFLQCAAAPIDGATYNDTVPVAVMASAPAGIVGWQAYVDGQLVTSSIAAQPTTGPLTGIGTA